MEDKLNLAIDGMHCAGCVNRVTAALNAIKGVQVEAVEVGSANVAFNPKQISQQQIEAAVERIGFKIRTASGPKG